MKKYELTGEFKVTFWGRKLFQIKALLSFGSVKAGDLGGWIEKEENLSQDGNAWVSGNAEVYGNAWVSGDAEVYGNAKVYGDAEVSGNAEVYGNAKVSGDAEVYGDADYTTIKGFGSCYRNTTFFKCKDGLVRVACGCFYGTIEEFKAKVKQTHGDTKLAVEYLKIAELMKYHFSNEEVE